MCRRIPNASAGESNPTTRPLPPRPSLEYERKQAKALLRRLRAGDPDALTRAGVRHSSLGADLSLVDAQLVIAREYGFASWPRLVQYFGDVERQAMTRRSDRSRDREFYDDSVRSLIAQHRNHRAYAGRSLAASVPRFYGKSVADVFASSVNENDARLTVARQYGCASWEVLMDEADAELARRTDPWRRQQTSLTAARTAIKVGDLAALKIVVAEHPECLRPSEEEQREWQTVVDSALFAEQRGVAGAREITDWLASQGLDVSLTLNKQLCGRGDLKAENVRFLLARGADPNALEPNGISVLEHALLRYWNGQIVDLIARRATPKDALWTAAGLGDVDGVSRFLDRDGQPTAAAHRHRPDFAAIGGMMTMLSAPVADDVEVLAEAFIVAIVNDRVAVLDYMLDRGFPIDYLGWEMSFVSFAAGNQLLRVVECLVRRGADLDTRGRHPDASARDIARERFENAPTDPTARRILTVCDAGNPDQLLAESEARPAPEPMLFETLQLALELAGDDALRQGRACVSPENLLIGVLRTGHMDVMRWAGVDVERLRAEFGARVLPSNERLQDDTPLLDAAAEEVMRAATAIVRQRGGDVVTTLHVLRALSEADDAFFAELLNRCGADIAVLRARLMEYVT
ncbi:MAG: Clp protease N-terminal domain-containing protein [Gemmatimonadaceae bacterium]